MLISKKQFSLKNNLIQISVMVSLFMLAFCITTILFLRAGINEEVREHNQTVLALIKGQIQESVVLPVNMIAKTTNLVEAGYEVDSQYITDYFETILLAHDYFIDIHVMNTEGLVINTAPYKSEVIGSSALYEPFFVDASIGDMVFTKVYISAHTGEPTISVTIHEEGYIIAADIDLNSLPISLNPVMGIDEFTNLAIIDQWGTYIVSDDYTNLNQRKQYPNFVDIAKASDENLEILNIGYERLDFLGWYIVYELNPEEMYGELNQISFMMVVGWLLLSILLLALIYFNSRRINHEIATLKEQTKHIISGDYKLKDVDYRFKELDALAKDFGVMSFEIEQRKNKIERINKTLEKNIAIAEEANKAKSNFLAVMSHEMRTPLNGIAGFLQMLKLSDLKKEDRELVNIISNSTQLLRTLINDILDVSRYEIGSTQFDSVNFDFIKLLLNTTKTYRTIAEEKGLKFEVKMNQNRACFVVSDPVKITQVLNNLLDNAIKFTDEGVIRVSCEIKSDETSVAVALAVSDSGIGIKKEAIPLLFKPFEQGDKSIQLRFGGTGLGLSICHSIIEHMGGQIEVESVYGIGTTISSRVVLPKGQSEVRDEGIKVDIHKHDFEMTKVLVVEDNKVNQMLIHRLLNKYGIDSDLAVNGREALNLYEYGRYHMIFMDCQMPLMDGFEATREIRVLDKDIPIIAMTAYASKEDRTKCFEAGMNDFLTKPLDLRKVSKLLGVEEQYLSDLSGESIDKTYEQTEVERQAHYLVDAIGFDYETCHELIITYVNQAIEIFEAIETLDKEKNYEEVLKKVHQIKGATGAVRLSDIHQMIIDAEDKMKNDDYTSGMIIIREVMKMPIFES